MLDKPQLRLARPFVYSVDDLDAAIRGERRRTRRAIRWIWAISMACTVAIAVSMRWQPWFAIAWWWTPVVGVAANAACWWFGIKAIWGRKA